MIGAVIAPVFKTTGVVGCQRMFVESNGEPIAYPVTDKDKPVRKATLGRCSGGACIIGDAKHGDPIVLTEGVETGLAIHQLTGWCVLACISAHGMEVVELDLVRSLFETAQSALVVAGDLDRSMRGQQAMVVAADRLRFELKARVSEWVPWHAEFPALISADEMPIEGKSVDWEDAINASPQDSLDSIKITANNGTIELTNPAAYEEAFEEPDDVQPDFDGMDEHGEDQKPKDTRCWQPFGPVYQKQHLRSAHEYLIENHGPGKFDRERGGGLSVVCFSGRGYLYKGGYWEEIDSKMMDLFRGQVRRYFSKHCKGVMTKEGNPRMHYIDADLSKSEIESITTAMIDESGVVMSTDSFDIRYWRYPNVRDNGTGELEVLEDRPLWDRVVHDFEIEVIPTVAGIFDIDGWRLSNKIDLMDNTPLLFNLGCIEAVIPVDSAQDAFTQNGLQGLEDYAWSLCPDWKKYLESTFRHDDPECAPKVIRELHKWIGNLLTGSIKTHSGNIGWLIGAPGAGKSVMLKVLEKLLGKKSIVSSTMDNLDKQFHLSSWIGKMLAMFPDMDVGRVDKRKIVELLKLISGSDPVAIDRKYLSEVPSFRLDTRIVVSANQMPSIPDPTLALVRRSIAFHFRYIVPECERDDDLPDRLTTPDSLAGIMLLCLIGLKNIDADGGFQQPIWYASLIKDFKAQSSPYAMMIEEYLDQDAFNNQDAWTSTKDLFALYKRYCEEHGHNHVGVQATVISQLKSCLNGCGWMLVEERIVDGKKGYHGIQINARGEALMNTAEGGEAGGHDTFTPPF